MLWKDFNATFADELKDPDFAVAYLEAALEEDGVETFLSALQNVANADAKTESLCHPTPARQRGQKTGAGGLSGASGGENGAGAASAPQRGQGSQP